MINMKEITIGRGEDEFVGIDLNNLIDTRMLVQANSGGGKSYTLRKILEETHGKVQQIVLDLEGEFSTLREKYDYLLVGKGGDIEINIRIADMLARKVLELEVSTIIDLYELKQHERITFVKRFLDALVNSPKNLWHPVLVVVDEAHIFCPEKAKCESAGSVIDLCTRGRKRGFCGLLATQRLSKLSKDACAELNNKIIGRTGLDIDMKRASEELGFTSKEQMLSLRNLAPGEFYYFGPSLSTSVKKMKIGTVKTTHPKSGERILKTSTPPTDTVREMIKKLTDLPKEAEKELKTLDELHKEINRLKMDNRRLTDMTPRPVVDKTLVDNMKTQRDVAVDRSKMLSRKLKLAESEYYGVIQNLKSMANKISKLSDIKIDLSSPDMLVMPPQNVPKPPFQPQRISHPVEHFETVRWETGIVSGGEKRMLQAAAMYYPNPVTKTRMAAIARLSHTSGTFGTYIANLKRSGLVEPVGDGYLITEEGQNQAGNVPPVPTGKELVEMWKQIIKGGAARMLQALADMYPNSMSKAELGEASGISFTSGTFGTYMAVLKRNGLIIVNGEGITAARELCGE